MWRKYVTDFLACIVIVCLGIFFMLDLRTPGLFTSHDSPAHMTRILAYDEGLHDGQFPVLWAGRVLWGVGSPVLMLNYQLPYYAIEILHQLKLSLTDSYKMTLALSFIGSGLAMYFSLRSRYSIQASLIGSLLYMIAPYRLVDVYVRGALGECFAFIFPPLLLYSFWRQSLPTAIISFAGLFLSHPVGSAFFSGYFFLYALIKDLLTKKLSQLKFFLISFTLAFLISAFNLIPTLALTKYTHYSPEGSNTLSQFPTISQLIYSPWGYGNSTDAPIDNMTFQLGVVHWATLIAAIAYFLTWNNIKKNWELLYNFWLTIIAIYLMTETSVWVYHIFHLTKIIDFPWRILMFVVFSIALIGTEIANKIKTKSLAWLLLIILSGALVHTNRNHRQINMIWPWKENDFWGWTGDAYGEYAAMYRETRDGSSFEFRAEPIMGKGKVEVMKNRSNYLSAETDSSESMKVRINIMYFPGWEVKVDGIIQTVDTEKSAKSAEAPCYVTTRTLSHVDDSGLIACNIPSGKHQIEASYKALTVQKWSNLISLLGIGGYLWILFRSFYPRSTKKMRS